MKPEDVSWETERLSGALLRGITFPEGFSFSECTLIGSEFHEADLREANLTEAEFSGTDLRNAVMKPASTTAPFSVSFEDPRFKNEIDFQEANHTDANLSELDFSVTDFRDAIMRGHQLLESLPSEIILSNPPGASLEDAQLGGGTDLRGANLSGERLYQTAFRDVRINDETQFGIDADEKPGKACR